MQLSTKQAVDREYGICADCRQTSSLVCDRRGGMTVCTNCGLVQQQHVYDDYNTFAKENTIGRADYRSNILLDEIGCECSHAICQQDEKIEVGSCKFSAVLREVWQHIQQLGSRIGLVRRVIDLAGSYWKQFRTQYDKVLNHKYHYAMACIRLACVSDGVSIRTIQEIHRHSDEDLRPLKPIKRITILIRRIRAFVHVRASTWSQKTCQLASSILVRQQMIMFEHVCHRIVKQYFHRYVETKVNQAIKKKPRVVASGIILAVSRYFQHPRSIKPILKVAQQTQQLQNMMTLRADMMSQFACNASITAVASVVQRDILNCQLQKPDKHVPISHFVPKSFRQKLESHLARHEQTRQKRQKIVDTRVSTRIAVPHDK